MFAGEGEISPEVKLGMAGNGDGGGDGGGAAIRRQRRPEAAAAVAAAVGLLPRPSLSSHLRGRSLLSFFK